MKFWFDILTPKQVNFFKPLVDELRTRGHEVLCTSRAYREVEELSALKGLEIMKMGEHGGDSLYGKARAGTDRVRLLLDLVKDSQPDCLVSFSSPEACRVAFGLRIRNVSFNDSPHAEAVCRLTVPLMDRLMCPWIIPPAEFTKYGISRERIMHYKALDPVVWIRARPNDWKPAYTHQDLKIDPAKKTITFRLQETKAAYVHGNTPDSMVLLDALMDRFGDCNLVVLCRYPDQLETARKHVGDRATVMENVVDGVSLLQLTDLFIGSGGTMNCEAALLGVPNISYAMHHVLVNKFLFRKGVSQGCKTADQMVKLARRLLYDEKMRKAIRHRSRTLLSQMEDPRNKIIKVLESHK